MTKESAHDQYGRAWLSPRTPASDEFEVVQVYTEIPRQPGLHSKIQFFFFKKNKNCMCVNSKT